MTKIEIDPKTDIAYVETGNKLGNIAAALNSAGRALPHGSCPYVGVGGHACKLSLPPSSEQFNFNVCTAFGGFGFTSRMWGLMTDTIRAATVVFANGTITRVTEQSYPDILWVGHFPFLDTFFI